MDDSTQRNLINIELAIDIFFTIEICFCFIKATLTHDEFKKIAHNYLTGYFLFDVVATLPNLLFLNEGRQFYWLKVFRFVHIYRLHSPLVLLMKCLLSKYSKKR
jgi:hypothetical protein